MMKKAKKIVEKQIIHRARNGCLCPYCGSYTAYFKELCDCWDVRILYQCTQCGKKFRITERMDNVTVVVK